MQVCNVTCCGLPNFEQHCASKRHLRKLAVAGLGAAEGGPASSGSSPQVPTGLSCTSCYISSPSLCFAAKSGMAACLVLSMHAQ